MKYRLQRINRAVIFQVLEQDWEDVEYTSGPLDVRTANRPQLTYCSIYLRGTDPKCDDDVVMMQFGTVDEAKAYVKKVHESLRNVSKIHTPSFTLEHDVYNIRGLLSYKLWRIDYTVLFKVIDQHPSVYGCRIINKGELTVLSRNCVQLTPKTVYLRGTSKECDNNIALVNFFDKTEADVYLSKVHRSLRQAFASTITTKPLGGNIYEV